MQLKIKSTWLQIELRRGYKTKELLVHGGGWFGEGNFFFKAILFGIFPDDITPIGF